MGLAWKQSAVLPGSRDRIKETFFTILTVYTPHLLITHNLARPTIQPIPLWNIISINSREFLKVGMFFKERILRDNNITEKCWSCQENYPGLVKIWKRRTHIGCLHPIPMWVVINYRVLAMTIIHLACLWCKLVKFNPWHLSSFTMKMTHPMNISWWIKVDAVVFVILNM